MISCIIATIIATRLKEASIYTLKLLRRGIDIKGGQSVDVLADLEVSDVMRREFATVSVDAPLLSILARLLDYRGNTIFVLDRTGRLAGLVTLDTIRFVVAETEVLENLAIAKDIMTEHGYPVFEADDKLAGVMKRLVGHVHEAPVVHDGQVMGSIWPDDLIARYNAEVFKRDMASGMGTLLNNEPQQTSIPGVPGMRMAEIKVPYRYAGQTISELDVRRKFGVTILLVRRKSDGKDKLVEAVPTADTTLQKDDMLLVMGENENIRRFEVG